jgi:hypothetical protein
VRRVWLQVALAALAGLGSLAVCSGALVAIVLLVFASGPFGWIGSSLDPTILWFGVVAAMIFAGAGLSLPALALGATGGHALKTTLLSSPVFGTFVFFSILSLDSRYGFVAAAISLLGLVGTSVVGSLVAVHEEEDHSIAVRLSRVSVIAAVAIYCASLLAYWLEVFGESWSTVLATLIVAGSSWLVLPAIVAMLRSG